MYCNKCGSLIPDNSKFCPKCGKNLQEDTRFQCETSRYDQDERQSSCPSNYLWLSILTTILCCLPFGIVGIVYSSKVDSSWLAGDGLAAKDYSNKAKNWSLIGIGVSAFIWLIYIICVAIFGIASLDTFSEF